MYKLILSRRFTNVLEKINDNISNQLLNLNNDEYFRFPFSYIDLGENDFITYTPSKIITSLLNEKVDFWITSRNDHKIGRFISKILVNEKPKNIETFVNSYKSEIKTINDQNFFEIVNGENFKKYYNYKYYSKGGGSLNKSCMRYDVCENYFDFYIKNDDKVSLLILYDNNKDKILGRTLLWNIDDPKIKLMDRIYTCNDSDQFLFKKYAIENGYYYKKTQRCDEFDFISPSGNVEYLDCKIYLKNINYYNFPYVDTFYLYHKKELYITNNKNEYLNNKYIIKLQAVNGRDQGNENFVFDIYNNDTVKINKTIICNFGDYRILRKDAIYLNDFETYISPDNVRYCEYNNKIYHKKDTLWSSYHKTFMKKNDCFKIFIDEKKTTFDYIHNNLLNKEFNYVENENCYFISELLIKGSNNNYYLKSQFNKDADKINVNNFDTFFDIIMKKIIDNNINEQFYNDCKGIDQRIGRDTPIRRIPVVEDEIEF